MNLVATPETGYHFINWTGDVADPDSATTTVTMDGDMTITAKFDYLDPTDVPMVTTGSPGLSRGTDCMEN